MHLHNNNCVLPTNNKKLIVLNILPLLRLARSDMVGIMWVFKDHKNGHFGVNYIVYIFLNLILVDIWKWTIKNVGSCFLEMMNINGNTRKRVISKRKATHELIAQYVIDKLAFCRVKSFIFFPDN